MTRAAPPAVDDLRAKVEALRDAHWTQDVRAGDPRFPIPQRQKLPHGRSIADEADELLGLEASEQRLDEFVSYAEPLRSIHRTISEQSLEDQLLGLAAAASGQSGDRLNALLDRLGWLSADQAILKDAGGRIGVTKERMRQLQNRVTERLPARVWLPKLDEALELLKQAAPILSDEASDLLQDAGITEQLLPPVAVDRAARALRGGSPFDPRLLAQEILYVGAFPTPPERIVSLASKRAQASGIASVAALCAELADEGVSLPVAVVRAILHSSDHTSLLDDSWFWAPAAPKGRNHLDNILARMLAVTPLLPLASILDGIEREYRFQNSSRDGYTVLRVPQHDLLAAYLEAHPEFKLSDAGVRLTVARDPKDVLGAEELALIDILRRAPSGVLPLSEAAQACFADGLKRSTTYIYLRSLPTVEEVRPGHFAARGVFASRNMAAQ